MARLAKGLDVFIVFSSAFSKRLDVITLSRYGGEATCSTRTAQGLALEQLFTQALQGTARHTLDFRPTDPSLSFVSSTAISATHQHTTTGLLALTRR
jgi:hypothetical protein